MSERYKINVNLYQASYLFDTIINNLYTMGAKRTRMELVQVLDELRSAIDILEEEEALRK